MSQLDDDCFMRLEAFLPYIESQQCEVFDNTDWGMPVYRNKINHQKCTVPHDDPVSSATISLVCKSLDIPIPPFIEAAPDFMGILRKSTQPPIAEA